MYSCYTGDGVQRRHRFSSSAEGYGAPAWQLLAVRFIALSIQSDVDDRHHPLSDRRLPTRVFGEVICCLRTTAPKVLCPRPS